MQSDSFARSSSATPSHGRQIFARIKALGERSGRDAQRAFFVEGPRGFIQAHDAGFEFQAIVHSPILLQGDRAEMIARRLHAAGTPLLKISPGEYRSLSRTARASGIGAIVRQRWVALESAVPAEGLCHLVIEHIRTPGNLGTILRTAEATGVGAVILVGNRTDPHDPAAVRGSMGGLFHLRLIRTTHDAFAAWARRHRVQLIGLSPTGPALWTELSVTQGPRALVLGEERQGISPFLQSLCTTAVRLPMTGRADSLNVAVAAGVMLYEMVRRTGRTAG